MDQPKQRDAERSRAGILDAAESLFADHGFEAVTMAQIGAAAGVSRGTPGYFFGTKEALYRVVVGRAAATIRMLAQTLRVRDALGTRAPAERLSETVDAFLSLFTSRATLVRLIDRESGTISGEPHAEALRSSLEGLGPDCDRVALVVLAMCWFPVSHPDAARLLGVDPEAPGFTEVWRDEIMSAIGLSEHGANVPRAGSVQPAPHVAVAAVEPEVAPSVAPVTISPAHGDQPSAPKKKKRKKKKKS